MDGICCQTWRNLGPEIKSVKCHLPLFTPQKCQLANTHSLVTGLRDQLFIFCYPDSYWSIWLCLRTAARCNGRSLLALIQQWPEIKCKYYVTEHPNGVYYCYRRSEMAQCGIRKANYGILNTGIHRVVPIPGAFGSGTASTTPVRRRVGMCALTVLDTLWSPLGLVKWLPGTRTQEVMG